MSLLRRSGLRWLRRHPGQAALSVVGVALGVAVVVSVDVASGSAERSFVLAQSAVTGRATHQVLGGPTGLPDEVWRHLFVDVGLATAAPVVEGNVVAAGGESLHLLGVDPLAEGAVRPFLAAGPGDDRGDGGAGPGTLRELLVEPGAFVATPATARALGLRLPSPSPRGVSGVSGHPQPAAVLALRGLPALHLVGTIEPADRSSAAALDGLLVCDLATAQEVLGVPGHLTRVDVVLPEGAAGEAAAARLRAALPPGTELAAAASRQRASLQMLAAFRLNLQALGLLAIVCGAFLVYNTTTFSVLQRREQLGLLRTLGVERREVLGMVLAEAAVVGGLGTVLGLAGGALLGERLVALVGRTVNDLYFSVAVRASGPEPATIAKAVALGLLVTLAAAVPAAREATAVAPRLALLRSELERRARVVGRRAAVAGLGLVLAGVLGLALPDSLLGSSLAPRFAALFLALVGAALATPVATLAIVAALQPLLRRALGAVGVLGGRAVGRGISRTGVAVAALTVAVSVAAGVDLMIASFRSTVVRWLETTLQADLYVTPAGRAPGAPGATLPPATVAALERLPGVVHVNRLRRADLPSEGEPLRLVAISLDARSHRSFDFRSGDPQRAWAAFHAGRGAIASEPLANRRGLRVGDAVALRTPRGEVRLPVVGIIEEYSSDRGLLFLDLGLYRRLYDDPAVNSVSLFVAPGADARAVAAAARRVGGVTVAPTRALREASLAIFDRTFAITGVLRLLTLLVALVGVVAALGALALERRHELAVLRAVGLEPAQLVGMVLVETGLLGLAASLLAMPLGTGLAAVMVYVINTRAFGWTMPLVLAPGRLAGTAGLALAAALLAGVVPALRLARTRPAEALRGE